MRTEPRPSAADLTVLSASLHELAVLNAEPGDPAGWGMALLGEVRDGPDAQPELTTLEVNHDPEVYFYPASSVKLLAALAAAEKLDAITESHPGVTLDSPWKIHPLFEGDQTERADPTNLEGGITLRHEIRKLFLVSDNTAFNRLYGFVGQAELNRRARSWGLDGTRVRHRLSQARTPDENRQSPEIDLFGHGDHGETGTPLLRLPERTDPVTVEDNAGLRNLRIGQRHMAGGSVVEAPLDFTDKNFASLHDLQQALAMLCDPEVFETTLAIRDDTRAVLLEAASQLPRESTNPVCAESDYPDDYVKFLLPGLVRVAPLQDWRITNKIGLAYGFVTENARVEHLPSGRSVYVAMTIYRNPNGTLNDDTYDYDTTLAIYADVGERVGRWLAGN